MILRRIGPLSCAKVSGLLYAIIGLIAGLFFSMFACVGAAAGFAQDEGAGALLGLFFGVGAIIIMPIFYGVMGFLGGLISAALYNGIAGMVGGVEVELEGPASPPSP